MKKYTFTATTLTACGPNFPKGKTFPARYELQDSADMKRGQLAPIVHVYATVDEKTVKIDVPADDEYYSDAYKAAKQAEQPAAEQAEQPAAEQAEQPAAEQTEQPAAEQTEQPAAEQAAKQAEQPAAEQPAAEQTEQPAAEQTEQPAAEQTEQPAAEQAEQPAAEQAEQPAAEQAEQPAAEQAEQPARDPKQAHGPIPEKTFVGTSIKGARFEILFDGKAQRTRVIIPAEYKDAARATVEKAGFYYSAPLDSWNKKLTFRAYRAAVALAAELEKMLVA